jgi:hypothetical protein
MQMLVRAFQVLPGRENQMREFATAVSTHRAADVADFYRRMGVARESWHLQETPHGTWIIGVTQIPDKPVAQAAQDYAASAHEFDQWFKDQVMLVTGVDPAAEPLGPPTQCIFDSQQLP